jgi:hypothetical protein
MPFPPSLAQTVPEPPEDIYDILVPTPQPPLWPLVLSLFSAAVLVLAVALLVRLLLRSRAATAPRANAAERARLAIERAERGDLSPNRFALALSEAVKNYLDVRFREPVRYETAEEFLARLSREGTSLPPAAQSALGDFLASAEEVKFGLPHDAAARLPELAREARDLVALCESINAPDGRG